MNIEDVPEGHWMLLDNQRNVLFCSKNCGEVMREGRKYPLDDVYIEVKSSGMCFFGIAS